MTLKKGFLTLSPSVSIFPYNGGEKGLLYFANDSFIPLD